MGISVSLGRHGDGAVGVVGTGAGVNSGRVPGGNSGSRSRRLLRSRELPSDLLRSRELPGDLLGSLELLGELLRGLELLGELLRDLLAGLELLRGLELLGELLRGLELLGELLRGLELLGELLTGLELLRHLLRSLELLEVLELSLLRSSELRLLRSTELRLLGRELLRLLRRELLLRGVELLLRARSWLRLGGRQRLGRLRQDGRRHLEAVLAGLVLDDDRLSVGVDVLVLSADLAVVAGGLHARRAVLRGEAEVVLAGHVSRSALVEDGHVLGVLRQDGSDRSEKNQLQPQDRPGQTGRHRITTLGAT